MKISYRTKNIVENQRGVAAIFVTVSAVVLLGVAAMAVDIGYLTIAKNELQNVADAGALAGAGYLGSVYVNLTYSEQQGYPFTFDEVANVVKAVALKNKAAGVDITIADADIVIGIWNGSTVDQTLTAPNAVQVTARRDGTANGEIQTFFAPVLNLIGGDLSTMNVRADATAALTGPSIVAEGELKTPFALSQNVFPNNCTDVIQFSPTTSSCAGWHNFFDQANASKMDAKMLSLIEGDGCDDCSGLSAGKQWLENNFDMNRAPTAEATPETSINDSYNFQGGNVASLFLGGVLDSDYNGNSGTILGNEKAPAPFPALFDYFRYRDGDGDNSVWSATVPVYEDGADCLNPSGPIKIVGFAKIVIRMPNPPPDTSVSVWVDCNQSVIDARGGGAIFGNLRGSIPNLVE